MQDVPTDKNVSASSKDGILFSITGLEFLDKFYIYDILKTRSKVVHKNVSQGFNLIKRSENFYKSCDIKVALCDL